VALDAVPVQNGFHVPNIRGYRIGKALLFREEPYGETKSGEGFVPWQTHRE
jgi:hypothetical protein